MSRPSRKHLGNAKAFAAIHTNNPPMFVLFEHVESIAPSPFPVLITGETGVGKELLAHAVHRLSGVSGPLVAVNVAGLDDTVFSDTLFGHEKGAFTGAERVRKGLIEKAANGTLLLDEIGDLSHDSQLKLLRLLQENEYYRLGSDTPNRASIRILASTNRDLWTLQKNGRFRKDLNFRIRAHHLHLPPLRDRLDDLPLLVDSFLREAAKALDRGTPTVTKEILDLLAAYAFPGNIRELRSLIYDAVSRSSGESLRTDIVSSYFEQARTNQPAAPRFDLSSEDGLVFPAQLPTIRQTTEILIVEAMRRTQNNQTAAAKLLGISQQALSKRLKK